VKQVAGKKGCTPAQLALAWVLARGQDVVPIPGTKRVKYLEENMAAIDVGLTDVDRREIDDRCRNIAIVGERYRPEMMALIDE
jgi:aryl-alcohol dehydrogenase-like predicted oxidoreductase